MDVLDRQSNEHISLALDRTKYMTFRIGRQDYGVDIVKVQDITCHSAMGAPHLKDVVDLGGTMVPIVRLTTATANDEPGDLFRIVIVVHADGKVAGLLVDGIAEILHVGKVDDEALELAPEIDRRYIGGVGRADDRLIALVDVDRVLEAVDERFAVKTLS